MSQSGNKNGNPALGFNVGVLGMLLVIGGVGAGIFRMLYVAARAEDERHARAGVAGPPSS